MYKLKTEDLINYAKLRAREMAARIRNEIDTDNPKQTATGFRVADAKRAARLLEGMGKSVSSIELLPGGGYRIVAGSDASAPVAGENPWNEVLK